MEITSREFWTEFHGIILGAVYLLAFTGGFVSLWDFRSDWITGAAVRKAARRLIAWTWTMAILAWLTVLVGTYVVYPWYRAKPPAGTAGSALAQYPKYSLLASPKTADWHEFGMEWKEHVAWLVPILATSVALLVTKHYRLIASDRFLRKSILTLYLFAFVAASIAGVFGAFINKAAPLR
ncbi:MAG TPA: hypothetical protein VFW23_18015 [Tepidisphaeraceae bacterium]|nr:hypothetical protein [Tepidisphaeraceae bacterium]